MMKTVTENSALVALSVCTTSFQSATFLRINRDTVAELNPGVEVSWIVAENSPPDSDERLSENEPGMQVIAGAGPGHTPAHHHTLALSSAIAAAQTRFVLVLDPDLFVVRPNWIREIIEHMQALSLAIFAVPWHPHSRGKYRYFPAVHFALFDTERFPKHAIDFAPDVPDRPNDPTWKQEWNSDQAWYSPDPLAHALGRLPWLKSRRRLHTSTGGRMYKQWAGDRSLRFELADPAWDPARTRPKLKLKARLLDYLLPEDLRWHPRHYSKRWREGFLGSLLPLDAPNHWEQFMWREEPFCFHVRGNQDRATRTPQEEAALVQQAFLAYKKRKGIGKD
jgi:hypothetical protein